jgi:hypothetical protein
LRRSAEPLAHEFKVRVWGVAGWRNKAMRPTSAVGAALDVTVQISGFRKLKLAHCARLSAIAIVIRSFLLLFTMAERR